MLKIILVLFAYVYLQACESNCVVCHPSLVKKDGKMDSNHAVLTTCVKCHTKKSLEKVDMGLKSCGEDCWKCHDIKKVSQVDIKEHKSLNKCIKCHTSRGKDIFKFDDAKDTSGKNLIDIIN
jgi:hypothetical protein